MQIFVSGYLRGYREVKYLSVTARICGCQRYVRYYGISVTVIILLLGIC